MLSNFRKYQCTIADTVNFSGIGLHSGMLCNVRLIPSAPDTGVVFIRKDLSLNNFIPADYRNIHKSKLCTTLKASNSDAKVITVEHLLAAIKGNNIDNIKIEIDSQEIPILDGSAKEFDDIIKNVGVVEQKKFFKKYLIVKKNISVQTKNSSFFIAPSNCFEIECTVEFPDPIGKQTVKLGKSFSNIYDRVKSAKTFCYYEDIEAMKKNNLAKGGSLENAIVIKNGSILNSEFDDQTNYFAKHKTLDILGDLSLMNFNIIGKISVYYPGHELNRLGMLEIFSSFSNYSIYQYNIEKKFKSQDNMLFA